MSLCINSRIELSVSLCGWLCDQMCPNHVNVGAKSTSIWSALFVCSVPVWKNAPQ